MYLRHMPGTTDYTVPNGTEIQTLTPLAEGLYDRDETGPMFVATFVGWDGITFHVFEDEVAR